MKKVVIKDIKYYNYTLVDNEDNEYIKNIEFYSNYKPMVNDIIYLDEKILDEVNLYSFDEIYDTKRAKLEDMIKVVHEDKEYYFQRRFG